jgi:hypothetical protein
MDHRGRKIGLTRKKMRSKDIGGSQEPGVGSQKGED